MMNEICKCCEAGSQKLPELQTGPSVGGSAPVPGQPLASPLGLGSERMKNSLAQRHP